ncbi:hypothetical protein QYF36_026294 [Acer negundo]|nr:hypothetical protein QYF36_026294 [Acer negundo]
MAVRSNTRPTPARSERSNRPYGSQNFRPQEQLPENSNGGCQFDQDRRRSAGHPKTKHNSGLRRFSNTHHKSAANLVSDAVSNEDRNQLIGVSEAQLKQLLSLIDNKTE